MNIYAIKLPWIYAFLPVIPVILFAAVVALISFRRPVSEVWWKGVAALFVGSLIATAFKYQSVERGRAAFDTAMAQNTQRDNRAKP